MPIRNSFQNYIDRLKESGGAPPVISTLKMWLKFLSSEPVSTRAADYSDQDNRATLRTGVALSFDGANDEVTFGNIGSVKWFYMYIYLDTTTQSIVDFNGTQSIEVTSGTLTATGVTSPTFYVDGVATTTITAGTWHRVDMYTSTAITASAFVLGKISSSFLSGDVGGMAAYDTEPSGAQIAEKVAKPELILPTGFTDANLNGHWFMNEGANFVVYGTSVNKRHGAINGATWIFGQPDPIIQTGLLSWNQSNNHIPASTDLTNATYWFQTRVVITTGFAAPNGSNTAFKVTQQNAGSTTTRLFRMLPTASGVSGANSVTWFVKANGINWVWLREDIASPTPSCYFDITPGGAGAVGTAGNCTASIEAIGGDWFKCTMNYTGGATFRPSFYLAGGDGAFSYTAANTTDGVYVWHPLMNEFGATYNCPTLAVASPNLARITEGLTANKDIFGIKDILSPRLDGALNLNGSGYGEVADHASLAASKSFSFWVKPSTTTEKLWEIISGSVTIQSSAGTISATGFTTPEIYVNGSLSSALTAGVWQMVTVETDTAINTGAMKIGMVVATGLVGQIRNPKVQDTKLGAVAIAAKYTAELPEYL